MGGVRSSRRAWIFWLACVQALLSGCGRTAKNSSTDPAPEGNAGAPAVQADAPSCALSIAANRSRHCAAYQDGSVWCWGTPGPDTSGPSPRNWKGSSVPQHIEGLQKVRRLVLGPRHSCAIGQDGLQCWGDNDGGQIDDSGVSPLPPTVVGLGSELPAPIKDVGLAEQQTCAVNAFSHVYCRGQDPAGPGPQQVNVAGAPDTTMPGSLPLVLDQHGIAFNPSPWNAPSEAAIYGRDNAWIGQGNPEACALKRWGSLWCTDDSVVNPGKLRAKVMLGESVVQAGAGELFACALTQDGRVWCEGFDKVGQTGNGANADFAKGDFISSLADVRAISVNGRSACALKADGSVWCWGAYAKDTEANVPTLVSGCEKQTEAPQAPEPFARLTRSSADRLAEAGRARGQAVCTSGPPLPEDTQEGCIAEEDFSPNPDCISALGPELNGYWDCRAQSFWETADCFARNASNTDFPSCPSPPSCAAMERPAVEAYCRRRACSLDQEQSVNSYQLCDGNPDCTDGSDELNCDRDEHSFDCGSMRIPLSAFCDAKPDCPDGADETYCQ